MQATVYLIANDELMEDEIKDECYADGKTDWSQIGDEIHR